MREGGRWLGWEEVQYYAALFDFPTVPEIPITTPLSSLYDDKRDENRILADWLTANLGMPWTDAVETAGALGGYDPASGAPCCEGFVIRNRDSYLTNNGDLPVAANEFDNLCKLVRAKHVKTDTHWSKTGSPLVSLTIRNTAGTPMPIGATEHVDLPALPPRSRP